MNIAEPTNIGSLTEMHYTAEYIAAARNRPCINCVSRQWQKMAEDACIHPDVAPPDLVKGIGHIECRTARDANGPCGINGRFFASLETPERTHE